MTLPIVQHHVNLFFCGDSVTYGMELEPYGRVEKRFSTLVSTEKNLTHHNHSLSGACNDWIVKNAIEFFRNGNTCDTAIIQFSAPERWLYWCDILKRFQNVGNATTTNNFKSNGVREAHKAYYDKIYSPELAVENYWKNVYFMNEYLKDKCEVLYLTLGFPVPRNNSWVTDVEIASVKEMVGTSRLVGHPSPEGHRKIADYILSKL
jgi:hypothetical protein